LIGHGSAVVAFMALEAFRSSDSEIRRQALAPFDEIAVCRFPLEADAKDAPLYAALAAGRSWPGRSVCLPRRGQISSFCG